jgi:hypothetical protein
MADTIKIRVKYRRAKYVSVAEPDKNLPELFDTLETRLRSLLDGKLGKDVNSREIKFQQDERHSLLLHISKKTKGALMFDLLHLDDRTGLTTWKRPKNTVPISEFGLTKLAVDNVSMNEPAYLIVSGNHIAMIERIGLSLGTIQNYINDILSKAKLLDQEKFLWKLIPKIEATGVALLKGGVEKIILKPRAALIGEASSKIPSRPKSRGYHRKIDEYIGHGAKIFELLNVFGAAESDIEKLRSKMSSDLVLRAKVEISISKSERSTEAKVSADDIETAFAGMTETSDIDIIDKDGRTNGKLTQLSHVLDIVHENGILDIEHAHQALTAAMASWAAQGSIELS